MNLIVLFKSDFIEGTRRVRIRDHRLAHIIEVNKSSVGDELRVGLIGGNIGTGRITFIDEGRVEMDVVLDKKPPAPLRITLVLAMVRPRVFKRILTQVSAMGIKRIILINSYLVSSTTSYTHVSGTSCVTTSYTLSKML